MNAVALLAAAFLSIAVVGTLAAALHDAVAVFLRQRDRGRVPGSSEARVRLAAPRVITVGAQERAQMTRAVATGTVHVRVRTSTSATGRLGA